MGRAGWLLRQARQARGPRNRKLGEVGASRRELGRGPALPLSNSCILHGDRWPFSGHRAPRSVPEDQHKQYRPGPIALSLVCWHPTCTQAIFPSPLSLNTIPRHHQLSQGYLHLLPDPVWPRWSGLALAFVAATCRTTPSFRAPEDPLPPPSPGQAGIYPAATIHSHRSQAKGVAGACYRAELGVLDVTGSCRI